MKFCYLLAFGAHAAGCVFFVKAQPAPEHPVTDVKFATFRVSLGKQRVPVIMDNRTVMYKTAYFGSVFIGVPAQRFTVVFDTGSGHVFIPSHTCGDEACHAHARYDSARSSTAVAVNFDGREVFDEEHDRDQISISYGTGKVVGAFVHDVICAGKPALPVPGQSLPPHCSWVRVILANQMSAEPFSLFTFDGVLGLGLGALALESSFHFLSGATDGRNTRATFGVFLAKTDDNSSEIIFGGQDDAKMTEPLRWVPVLRPEQGYWRVAIQRIRVGGQVLDLCEDGGCSAILDTGTSILGAPTEILEDLFLHTARHATGAEDCRDVPGPRLTFELSDTVDVALDASDYSRPAALEIQEHEDDPVQYLCRAALLPVDMPPLGTRVFLFGEPVLQKYYTAYDAESARIGLALSIDSGRQENSDIGSDGAVAIRSP